VAISNQQPRCHQPEAIGRPSDKNPTHRGQCLRRTGAVNPKPASIDANSASHAARFEAMEAHAGATRARSTATHDVSSSVD
jgi:hypothetical protein